MQFCVVNNAEIQQRADAMKKLMLGPGTSEMNLRAVSPLLFNESNITAEFQHLYEWVPLPMPYQSASYDFIICESGISNKKVFNLPGFLLSSRFKLKDCNHLPEYRTLILPIKHHIYDCFKERISNKTSVQQIKYKTDFDQSMAIHCCQNHF